MDYLSELPSGPLYDILDFLPFPDIIKCSALNKTIFHTLHHQKHLLFKLHLNREFPSYLPFQNLSNIECVNKLISFHKRDFKWDLLGSCDDVKPRFLHRSTLTKDGDMLLFGGAGVSNRYFNDTWKVSYMKKGSNVEEQICFQQFTSKTQDKITPRGSCSMCTFEGYAFAFGGREANGTFLNCLMSLSVETGDWDEVHPCEPLSHAYPNPRWGHTALEWEGLLIVFGGGEYGRTFNDLWVLDLKSLERSDTSPGWIMRRGWKQINPFIVDAVITQADHEQPLGRSGHACLLLEEHFMYMLGGNNLNQTFQDMWRINLHEVAASYVCLDTSVVASVVWERILPTPNAPCPQPQIGHVAVALGSHRFLLYGGRNVHGRVMLSGTLLYDARDNSWESFNNIQNHEVILNRTGHCVLPTERGILFVGGLCADEKHTAEVISLDLFTCAASSSSSIDGERKKRSTSMFSLSNIVHSLSSSLSILNSQQEIEVMRPPVTIPITRGTDI